MYSLHVNKVWCRTVTEISLLKVTYFRLIELILLKYIFLLKYSRIFNVWNFDYQNHSNCSIYKTNTQLQLYSRNSLKSNNYALAKKKTSSVFFCNGKRQWMNCNCYSFSYTNNIQLTRNCSFWKNNKNVER